MAPWAAVPSGESPTNVWPCHRPASSLQRTLFAFVVGVLIVRRSLAFFTPVAVRRISRLVRGQRRVPALASGRPSALDVRSRSSGWPPPRTTPGRPRGRCCSEPRSRRSLGVGFALHKAARSDDTMEAALHGDRAEHRGRCRGSSSTPSYALRYAHLYYAGAGRWHRLPRRPTRLPRLRLPGVHDRHDVPGQRHRAARASGSGAPSLATPCCPTCSAR